MYLLPCLWVFKLLSLITNSGIPELKRIEYINQQPVGIIEPTFRKICDGIPGSEGPVFDKNGNFYAVSPNGERSINGSMDNSQFHDMHAGKLHKINLETGEKEDVCAPVMDGYGGRPAGAQADKFGNIWIADIRLGIFKYSAITKECKMVTNKDVNGNQLHGVNDLVFDKTGNLWITAPASLVAPVPGNIQVSYTKIGGELYFLENGHTRPVPMNESLFFSNGIAIRDNLLLVAETMERRIVAYDIIGKGKLANKRVWANLPETVYNNPLKIGGPDGMDFDDQGRLLVAHHGSSHIEVYSTTGQLEARIKCPFLKPSNLQFKPGSRTCYVTEHEFNGVWEFEWITKGMPMNYF